MQERELIELCRKKDRRAQQQLYDRYGSMLFAVCKRYVMRKEDAEDVLVEAFFKIFTHLDQYKAEGSFEGWMRRITANEALMFLRRRNLFQFDIEIGEVDFAETGSIHSELAAGDILSLLEKLPTGYRTVFNLYVMEGFKHREIADLLGISINTSKSQLILARRKLQAMLGMEYQEEVISTDQTDWDAL
jgi:RNA polymerase sigma-70 factor (ECF subfamily)